MNRCFTGQWKSPRGDKNSLAKCSASVRIHPSPSPSPAAGARAGAGVSDIRAGPLTSHNDRWRALLTDDNNTFVYKHQISLEIKVRFTPAYHHAPTLFSKESPRNSDSCPCPVFVSCFLSHSTYLSLSNSEILSSFVLHSFTTKWNTIALCCCW